MSDARQDEAPDLQEHGDRGAAGPPSSRSSTWRPAARRQRVVDVGDGGPDAVELLLRPRSGSRRSRAVAGPAGSPRSTARRTRPRHDVGRARRRCVDLVGERGCRRAAVQPRRWPRPPHPGPARRARGSAGRRSGRSPGRRSPGRRGRPGGRRGRRGQGRCAPGGRCGCRAGGSAARAGRPSVPTSSSATSAEQGRQPGAQRQPGARGARASAATRRAPAISGIDTRHSATSSVIGPPLHRCTWASSPSSRAVPASPARPGRRPARSAARCRTGRRCRARPSPRSARRCTAAAGARRPGPRRPGSTTGVVHHPQQVAVGCRRPRPTAGGPTRTGGRMAGEQRAGPSRGRAGTSSTATVANVSASTSVRRNWSRCVSTRSWGRPARRESPPGAAQAGAEGGGVRAVAGDVADEHRDGAVGGLDRVVEVAAQLGVPRARPGSARRRSRRPTAAAAAGSAPAPCGCCRPAGARRRRGRAVSRAARCRSMA